MPNKDGHKITEDAKTIRKSYTASGGGVRVSSDHDKARYIELLGERRCWREVVLEVEVRSAGSYRNGE